MPYLTTFTKNVFQIRTVKIKIQTSVFRNFTSKKSSSVE